MSTVSTLDRFITITPGIRSGKPHITGHRITVSDIAIWHERLGLSADDIASKYQLSLAEVYAALAYYFDHREEIEREIRDSDALAETLRPATSLVRQKLYGR
jgi:uncharacterized protein (DUF433 family)